MFVAQQPFCLTSEHSFTLSVGGMLCPFPSWLPYSIHSTIVHCLPFLLSLSLRKQAVTLTSYHAARQQESLLLSPSHTLSIILLPLCMSYTRPLRLPVLYTRGGSLFSNTLLQFSFVLQFKVKKMFLALWPWKSWDIRCPGMLRSVD